MNDPPRARTVRVWQLCLLSAGAVCLLVPAVYVLRGIWPFGAANIACVDDTQYYIPGLYRMWDYFHGLTAGSVSWLEGLASRSAGSLTDWLNPAKWVFFFLPRDRILEGLSLYLLVYLVLISLTASFALGKRFPHIGLGWGLVLTLLYVFSGYVLQYYSNFSWLFMAELFPLLLFGLERLLREGKWGVYAVMYAILAWWSIYFTYMVSLYVLLFSACYVLFALDREKRGDRLLRLGLSTAGALGATAFEWLGSGASIVSSSRYQSNVELGVRDWMTGYNAGYLYQTVLMLLGMELLAVLLILCLRGGRGADAGRAEARRRAGRFYLALSAALLVPVVALNIDTMWHFGPYNFFPMRYGFVLPATLISGGGWCLEYGPEPPALCPPGQKRTVLRTVFACLCAGGAMAAAACLIPTWQTYGTCFLDALNRTESLRYWLLLAGAALLWCAAYFFLLRTRRRWTVWVALGFVVLQTGINAAGLLGPDDSASGHLEYGDAYVHESDGLYAYFSDREPGVLDRAKNIDSSLNGGYPSLAGVSALSSVKSIISADDLWACRDLGYTTNYFMLLDTGGTVFSDMLLGVRTALSQTGLDEELYTYETTVGSTQVGQAVYQLRQGLVYAGGALDGYDDCQTVAQRLNCLYAAFAGGGTVARDIDAACDVQGQGMASWTLTFEAGDAEFVYMAVDGAAVSIAVNGQSVAVPSYGNLNGIAYPAQFNSNLLYLGCFENQTVTVTFLAPDAQTAQDVTLLGVDRAAVASFDGDASRAENFTLTQEGKRLTITADADAADELLYLPVHYRSWWFCAVNGREVQLDPVMGGLVFGIPLDEGENTITLEPYHINYLGRGYLLAGATLLLTAAYLLLRRLRCRWAVRPAPRWMGAAAGWLFALVCAGAAAFVYLIPAVLLIADAL